MKVNKSSKKVKNKVQTSAKKNLKLVSFAFLPFSVVLDFMKLAKKKVSLMIFLLFAKKTTSSIPSFSMQLAKKNSSGL